jgi:hypothetical protein
LQASGEVEVSARAVALPDPAVTAALEQQVQDIAQHVTEMARLALEREISH